MTEDEQARIATEAASTLAAYDLELITWSQVIAWADAWVMRLDRIPDDLLDVSLNATNLKSGKIALFHLAASGRGRPEFLGLIPHWRKAFAAGRLTSLQLARQVWQMRGCLALDWETDEDILRHVYTLDHLHDEVTGIYQITNEQKAEALQQLEEACREFLDSRF